MQKQHKVTQQEVKGALNNGHWNHPKNLKYFTKVTNKLLKEEHAYGDFSIYDAVDALANEWSLGQTE